MLSACQEQVLGQKFTVDEQLLMDENWSKVVKVGREKVGPQYFFDFREEDGLCCDSSCPPSCTRHSDALLYAQPAITAVLLLELAQHSDGEFGSNEFITAASWTTDREHDRFLFSDYFLIIYCEYQSAFRADKIGWPNQSDR